MRVTKLMLALCMVFAAAMAFGFNGTEVQAAGSSTDLAAMVADVDGIDTDIDGFRCRIAHHVAAFACPCSGPHVRRGETREPWKNHGEYVKCINDIVKRMKDHGLDENCAGEIISSAASSDIGKKGHECRRRGGGR